MPDVADDVDEHPIIFNEWSVRRILAGEKTQTRRIVSGHDQILHLDGGHWPWYEDEHGDGHMMSCPYGHSGDVLWVREAFRLPHIYDEMNPTEYVEEGPPYLVRWETDEGDYNAVPKDGWGRKRPSIYMPRELCRFHLSVEDVRVERVQDIGPADAHAEGIPRKPKRGPNGDVVGEMNPIYGFKQQWNDIHGDGAWDENPWVWVVKFSRIKEK